MCGGAAVENLSARLTVPGTLAAGLSYYPPGLRQDAHTHRVPHVSVLVAGSFRETTPRGEHILCHGSIGFRADESRHAVCFGPAGALILNVALGDWAGAGTPGSGVRWFDAPAPFARDLLGLAAGGGAEAGADLADRLIDLWATGGRRDRRSPLPPPAWLRDAAERLLISPETNIAALATGLGVHRVHLARRFRRHYGMAPSTFRRRAMASRALAAALDGDVRLADAAAEAGFADQSHMARAVRETCAMSVGELRLLLRRVSSVQAHGRRTA